MISRNLILTLWSVFLLDRKLNAKIIGSVVILGSLCFYTQLNAQQRESDPSTVSQSILTYLDASPEISIFVTALKQTNFWNTVQESNVLTVFVPTNEVLHKEGSAFLLEIVLNKIENKDRLDNLMALHVYPEHLQIDAKTNWQFSIQVPDGDCIDVVTIDGVTKIGPQAQVMKTINAENGTLHFVDHLLWLPYTQHNKCAN